MHLKYRSNALQQNRSWQKNCMRLMIQELFELLIWRICIALAIEIIKTKNLFSLHRCTMHRCIRMDCFSLRLKLPIELDQQSFSLPQSCPLVDGGHVYGRPASCWSSSIGNFKPTEKHFILMHRCIMHLCKLKRFFVLMISIDWNLCMLFVCALKHYTLSRSSERALNAEILLILCQK